MRHTNLANSKDGVNAMSDEGSINPNIYIEEDAEGEDDEDNEQEEQKLTVEQLKAKLRY